MNLVSLHTELVAVGAVGVDKSSKIPAIGVTEM